APSRHARDAGRRTSCGGRATAPLPRRTSAHRSRRRCWHRLPLAPGAGDTPTDGCARRRPAHHGARAPAQCRSGPRGRSLVAQSPRLREPSRQSADEDMATPAFPLPLRNALATLACEALEADDARAAVEWLARPAGPPPADAERRLAAVHLVDAGGERLLDVHAPWDSAIRAHAVRALEAAAAYRRRPAAPPDDAAGRPAAAADDAVGRAIVRAAALWNEGLFFEVHEVLEAVWQRESGDRRQALQGVIQIAVAWHHLAHGNPRGARTLLREGRARLAA